MKIRERDLWLSGRTANFSPSPWWIEKKEARLIIHPLSIKFLCGMYLIGIATVLVALFLTGRAAALRIPFIGVGTVVVMCSTAIYLWLNRRGDILTLETGPDVIQLPREGIILDQANVVAVQCLVCVTSRSWFKHCWHYEVSLLASNANTECVNRFPLVGSISKADVLAAAQELASRLRVPVQYVSNGDVVGGPEHMHPAKLADATKDLRRNRVSDDTMHDLLFDKVANRGSTSGRN